MRSRKTARPGTHHTIANANHEVLTLGGIPQTFKTRKRRRTTYSLDAALQLMGAYFI